MRHERHHLQWLRLLAAIYTIRFLSIVEFANAPAPISHLEAVLWLPWIFGLLHLWLWHEKEALLDLWLSRHPDA